MVETTLLDAVVQGIITGSLIAAGALGLSLIYNIAEVPNFAHGDMITIGAYLALAVNHPSAIPFLPNEIPALGALSLLPAAVVGVALAAVLGGVYEFALFRRFRRKDADVVTMIIVSLGLALVLRNVVLFLAGSKNVGYQTPLVQGVNWDFYVTPGSLTVLLTQRRAGDIVTLQQWGYPWWLLVGIVAAAVAAGYGLYRYRTGDQDFTEVHVVDPRVQGLVAGVATFVALAGLLRLDPGATSAAVYRTRVSLSWKDLTVVGVMVVAMFLLNVVMKTTRLGKAMRATADNTSLAEVRGVDVDRVQFVVWVIAALLAGLVGVLAGWQSANLNPEMGFALLLPVFAAVIMGGISSPYGAALGGLLIGISMDVGVYLLPANLSVYREAIAFVILVAVLLFKPEGLWGDV